MRSRAGEAWRKTFGRSKKLLLGTVILFVVVASALLAPVLTSYDPVEADLAHALEPPSRAHVFGTDQLGRDLLSRLLYAGRVTMGISLLALTVSAAVGVTLGLVAGYWGGRVDGVIMRCVDAQLAFPGILLAIAILAVLGPTLPGFSLALGISPIPAFARLTRGCVLRVKSQEYLESVRAVGARDLRILWRHVLPNISAPLFVQASLSLADVVLLASSLGFLGLGVQPPTPEWGAMLSDGRSYLYSTPHVAVIPGLLLALSVFAFTMMGDGLRDALDPRIRAAAFRS